MSQNPQGRVEYDEFGLFCENAEEHGLAFDAPPVVRREFVDLRNDGSAASADVALPRSAGERCLSALVWGDGDPEVVLLHGGAQNAHTWDTVAMALGRPLVAIDLPGHGHSGGGMRGPLVLSDNAADVAKATAALAPNARGIVGMSLGGATALALFAVAPELVRALVLVDITPGVTKDKARAITSFIDGPERFQDFDELLARTVEFNPTRSVSSLRRGILHNALQTEDGSWVWRHARWRAERSADAVGSGGAGTEDGSSRDAGVGVTTAAAGDTGPITEFASLWEVVGSLSVPLMLVRGTRPGSVVDDSDEAELVRRCPRARVEHVDAGHSVQGDAPLELARLIGDFLS